jgi:hypothetical protein
MMNLAICCSVEVCSDVGISVTLIYVNTVDNLADPISCGILPPSSQAFPLSILILTLSSRSSHMSQSDHLATFLNDVDISVQAAAFYANAPPLDLHQVASLPVNGCICIPWACKDAHILPSLHQPTVLTSEHVLHWTTPHSDQFQTSREAELPSSSRSCSFLSMKTLVATMVQVFFASLNTAIFTPSQNIVVCQDPKYYCQHSPLLQLVLLQRVHSAIGWWGSNIGMLSMVPHGMAPTCFTMFAMDLQSLSLQVPSEQSILS